MWLALACSRTARNSVGSMLDSADAEDAAPNRGGEPFDEEDAEAFGAGLEEEVDGPATSESPEEVEELLSGIFILLWFVYFYKKNTHYTVDNNQSTLTQSLLKTRDNYPFSQLYSLCT